jgi:hypothetical protein
MFLLCAGNHLHLRHRSAPPACCRHLCAGMDISQLIATMRHTTSAAETAPHFHSQHSPGTA